MAGGKLQGVPPGCLSHAGMPAVGVRPSRPAAPLAPQSTQRGRQAGEEVHGGEHPLRQRGSGTRKAKMVRAREVEQGEAQRRSDPRRRHDAHGHKHQQR